jgi:hypothetical protein
LGFSLIVSATLDTRPTRIGAEYLALARDFRRQVNADETALIAQINTLWWPVLITL